MRRRRMNLLRNQLQHGSVASRCGGLRSSGVIGGRRSDGEEGNGRKGWFNDADEMQG